MSESIPDFRNDITRELLETGKFEIDFNMARFNWWWPRSEWNKSHMRLTHVGYKAVSSIMTPYKFPFKVDGSWKTVVLLTTKMTVPYYWDNWHYINYVVIFSPKLAVMIELYGSINRYLEIA